MKTLARTVSLLTTLALLASCGGNAAPGNDDPGPGDPPPTADCREAISGDLSVPTVLFNGPEDCDYYFPGGDVANYRVTSDLQVEPGTVVRFGVNAMLYVRSGGSLTAVGTSESKITFEGEQVLDGYWHGICFEENHESRLEFVDIRSAGKAWSPTGTSGKGAIAGSYPAGEAVHIQNTHVSGSYVSGLSAHYLTLGEFANNAFFGNREYGVAAHATQVLRLDAESDYLGADHGAVNGKPFVYAGGHIRDTEEPHIWLNLNAPYFASSDEFGYDKSITADGGTTLVIEEGTRLVFEGDSELYVSGGSALGLGGTPENPVVLTGLDEEPGSWNGVRISNSAAILSNVEILWGGRDDLFYEGSLYFVEVGTDARGKMLENVFIDGSANCALVIEHEDVSVFDPLDVRFGSNNERDRCTGSAGTVVSSSD